MLIDLRAPRGHVPDQNIDASGTRRERTAMGCRISNASGGRQERSSEKQSRSEIKRLTGMYKAVAARSSIYLENLLRSIARQCYLEAYSHAPRQTRFCRVAAPSANVSYKDSAPEVDPSREPADIVRLRTVAAWHLEDCIGSCCPSQDHALAYKVLCRRPSSRRRGFYRAANARSLLRRTFCSSGLAGPSRTMPCVAATFACTVLPAAR